MGERKKKGKKKKKESGENAVAVILNHFNFNDFPRLTFIHSMLVNEYPWDACGNKGYPLMFPLD